MCYELKREGGSYMTSQESPESVHHPLYRHIAAERVWLLNNFSNSERHNNRQDIDNVFFA